MNIPKNHILEKITTTIQNEGSYKWNESSLAMYINNLYYMFRGEVFKRAINQDAKDYFIRNICKDFGDEICEKAMRSLSLHEEYMKKQRTSQTKDKQKVEKDRIKGSLDSKKIQNLILYGPPGAGKTYSLKGLILDIERGEPLGRLLERVEKGALDNDETNWKAVKERVAFLTFHQSFGYEDFIEGFRPNRAGQIELVDGVFKTLAKRASQDREHGYYLVIDEINRGNISKIFGELITLIEEDKRDSFEVILPYSKEPFTVPSNLYIVGTMNTADKSIALIDVALRRRFTFVKMDPRADLIEDVKAKELFEELNALLKERLGEEKIVGHSYFMGPNLDLPFVIRYKIRPLMEEYFYGDPEGLGEAENVLKQFIS